MAAPGYRSRLWLIASIGILYAFFGTGTATSQVPLLLWSNEGLPPLAAPAAGHITAINQLAAYLSSALGSGSHTVLLFLQDKLSKDDFTAYGGVYGNKEESSFRNLEAALQASPVSVTLPALECTGSPSVLALLQETLGVSPLLVDADTLGQISVEPSSSNLLVVNLPDCTGLKKSCREVFQHNDEIIGKVLGAMKDKDVPYTAMYTGLQPSRVISDPAVSQQHPAGRSLLQAPAPAPTPPVHPPITYNSSGSPCIMLWARNLNVSFSRTGPWVDLATQTPTLRGSQCSSNSSLLVLSYSSGITLSFAMSQRRYPVSARNWFTLDTVRLQSNGETMTFNGSRGVYAPAEYSFHCQLVSSVVNPLLIPASSAQNLSNWRLNFVDFQIQGFGLGNSTNFSYASDCASFFTPGIWMGLLTSLLMLLIFVYGLHMILQLNTMDRFDDPKGPTISVPQTE